MENSKLNYCVVMVKLDGKDLYLEPGTPFAPFGMLSWSLTGAPGLSLDKDGGSWVKTTLPQSSESRIEHTAKFKLTESGDLEGKVTVAYTGLEALYHRLDVRNSDDVARKKFFEDRIRNQVPMSAEVQLTNQPDWDSPEKPLLGEFNVTIPGWASGAGKREILSVGIFAATEKRVFERENRVHPIYIDYPYQKLDDITIDLPEGWQVGSVPPPQSIDGHIVTYALQSRQRSCHAAPDPKADVEPLFLDQKYYTALRNFFQTVRTDDDQQIVLQPAAASGS